MGMYNIVHYSNTTVNNPLREEGKREGQGIFTVLHEQNS